MTTTDAADQTTPLEASPPSTYERPLRPGLEPLELAALVRAHLREDLTYLTRQRRTWRTRSSVTRVVVLALSATATVVLGLASLDGLASVGFICSALVTTASAVEPFFNWRARWVSAEASLAEWYRIDEALTVYVAQTEEVDLDRQAILELDRERRAVWETFSGQWIEQRTNAPQQAAS